LDTGDCYLMMDAFLRLYNVPLLRISTDAKSFVCIVEQGCIDGVCLVFFDKDENLFFNLIKIQNIREKVFIINSFSTQKIPFEKIITDLCNKPILYEYIENTGRPTEAPDYTKEAELLELGDGDDI
jgi:hypothetical protein